MLKQCHLILTVTVNIILHAIFRDILNVNTSKTALICIFCSMLFKIKNHLILYCPIKSIYFVSVQIHHIQFKYESKTRINYSKFTKNLFIHSIWMKTFSCAKIPIRSTRYENSSHLIVCYVSELTLINSLLCFNLNWLKKSILQSFQL